MKVVVSLGAQVELAEAMQWWSEHSVERGSAFHLAYRQLERRIGEHPEWFPEVEPGIRRALMTGFRYSAFFVVKHKEATIVAVAHQHRRPGYWRERLR